MNTPQYIHELPDGNFRYSTDAEIADALVVGARRKELWAQMDRAKAELEAISKECKHLACVDTDGFPYTIRDCVACGYGTVL